MIRAQMLRFTSAVALLLVGCSTVLDSPAFIHRASVMRADGGGQILTLIDGGAVMTRYRCDEVLVDVDQSGDVRFRLEGARQSLPSATDPYGSGPVPRMIRLLAPGGFDFAGMNDGASASADSPH